MLSFSFIWFYVYAYVWQNNLLFNWIRLLFRIVTRLATKLWGSVKIVTDII